MIQTIMETRFKWPGSRSKQIRDFAIAGANLILHEYKIFIIMFSFHETFKGKEKF